VGTPRGVVFAPHRAEAERVAAHATAGEGRFRRHFGRVPPPYAVVLGRITPQVRTTLSAAGVRNPLPWFTAAQRETRNADAARRTAETIAKAQGLDGAKQQELISQISRQLSAQVGDREAGVEPHELGHQWLIDSFWPSASADSGGHYGGPAPDWLDETAAILTEDERMTNERRDQFRAMYTGRSPMAEGPGPARPVGGRPDPLPVFLLKNHPLKGDQELLMAQGGANREPRTIMMVKPSSAGTTGAGPDSGAAPRFYLQGRAFADFLVDRAGDPAVFAKIAGALAAGRTLDQWLGAEGAALGLGTSTADLERHWTTWLQARFGPASPAT
jgi:hypothetical protein